MPSILDWSLVGGFKYSTSEQADLYEDLDIDGFLSSIRPSTTITLGYLKSRQLFCMDASGDLPLEKWTAYRCFYCEIKIGKHVYLLNNGRWYEVETSFVESVNRSIARIKENNTLDLPDYEDDDEAKYNQRAARGNKALACMDRKTIYHGGGRSQIEFCDLYDSSNGVLVYVKRYSGSSGLSHLFEQGIVAGVVFLSDSDFRKKLNRKLPQTHKLADALEVPDARDYEIAFVVISTRGRKLELPFFSKVALRLAAQQLKAYGYTVTLTRVGAASDSD